MLTRPTVLVLGAGASHPFGFPIGMGLSNFIVKGLRPDNTFFQNLMATGQFVPEELLEFRESFFGSGRYSIDAFLEGKTERQVLLGKYAIANCLVGFENLQKLNNFEDNWLREFYTRLGTTFETFSENKFSIITYNYDRTVEQFFFQCLKSYGRTNAECRAVMDRIPIIHLHGRLGYLPWQGGASRPFNANLDSNVLKICADNIQIIHEPKPDTDEFIQARRLLREADQIVFLGFGYNATNVERLEIQKLAPKRMFGTCMNLGSKGEDYAKAVCGDKLSLVGGDCTHFARELIDY